MITALTVLYLICYQSCAIPAIVRIVRRRSSDDLSLWREVLVLVGLAVQTLVMVLVHAPWQVWISPVLSAASGLALLFIIITHRQTRRLRLDLKRLMC